MSIIIYLLFVFFISVLFARLKQSFRVFLILFSLATVYLPISLDLNPIIIYVITVVLILVNLVLLNSPIRLMVIQPILNKLLKNTKLSISETEKIAMECGDTYWEKELFSTHLDWNQLFNIQAVSLSNEEQAFSQNQVPKLCEVFKQFGLSEKTLEHIKSEGFWALNIPKSYGGLDFSAKAHAKILSQLSACDVSLAVTVMVPNSLGPAELVLHYGTDVQKKELLPKLASGEHVPCFALTSTDAGSDAGAMVDSGVICKQKYNGKNTLGIRLNWCKRYTTLAPISTLIGLAFKTYDPDGLLGDNQSLGITCALVDSHLSGVDIGRHHHPIGSNFSNGPHQGKNVFIPMSAVIGGEKMIGKGWSMLMESLSLGRGVSLPSLSLAGTELSLKTSIEYSLVRRQFKQSLYRFQGVAEKIVAMAADTLEMKAMSSLHLDLLDQGLNPSISSAILKYHHTESLRKNVNYAMDIHGGKTVMLGDKNYLSDIYQVIPIAITVEGANILTRSMIIFGQGLMRCHAYLKDELEAIEGKNYTGFNQIFSKHISHLAQAKVQSFIFSLTNAHFAVAPNGVKVNMKRYYQKLSMLSANFTFLVEMVLVKYGSGIKFQESINGLLADLLIKMFGISALLRQSESLGSKFDELNHWVLQMRINESQTLLKEICTQFGFSPLIKRLILPWGVNQNKPPIQSQNQIINQLVFNSDLKKYLSSDILLNKTEALEKLEHAYQLAIHAEKIYKKVGYVNDLESIKDLFKHKKITQQAYQVLTDLYHLRAEVLAVDDYEN